MLAILDFGGQYVENIRRCFLEMGIEAKIVPWVTKADELRRYRGIILSGGPYSVYQNKAPLPDKKIFSLNVPILGLCYGHQSIAHLLGGKVEKGGVGEYGFAEIETRSDDIFKGLGKKEVCWMSHGDVVSELPEGFRAIASSTESKIAAFRKGRVYGLQFHPEVGHTPKGSRILENFAKICGFGRGKWDAKKFIKEAGKEAEKIKGRAIIAVSGGVDSTVAAALAGRFIDLHAVHIDTGLMRKGESKKVAEFLEEAGVHVEIVNAEERFLEALEGAKNSDDKRRAIGKTFIEIFEEIAKRENAKYLIQGTIAPDVIESTRGSAKLSGKRHAGKIKLHHNVGGLPERMKLKIYEPLRPLFKYQVRELGKALMLPKELVERQPFPGPGLGSRITGKITREKLAILREATDIAERALSKYRPSQYFAALVEGRIVEKKTVAGKEACVIGDEFIGVKGDERLVGKGIVIRSNAKWLELLKLQASLTGAMKDVCRIFVLVHGKPGTGYGIILRAVDTQDFMTASPAKINFSEIGKAAKEIVGLGAGFVAYEITTKPPATIEVI